MRLFSSEQVSRWHPDKYCDQISDAILTEYLKQDRDSHCGIEVMAKGKHVVIGGEVKSSAYVDVAGVARRVADKLGYKIEGFTSLLSAQSPEICNAVTAPENIGAGDQGMMYGYAVRETTSRLPFGFDLANEIIKRLEDDKNLNPYTILQGDAKTQVTVDLDIPENEGINRVKTVLISVCTNPDSDLPFGDTVENVKDEVRRIVKPLGLSSDQLLINPSGYWTIGGPEADCGLTGRKIVCDQYGGYCAVGGGAFSGKDPTKVDRSASYMARKIACDIVDVYGWDDCKVQLAYAIGVSEPVSVLVESSKGETISPDIIRRAYDLTPKGIIESLNLYHIDYEKVAEGCHYRPRVLFF